MNKYRTHKCNELRKEDVDKKISLSGWINKKRDHGNLLLRELIELMAKFMILYIKSTKLV